MIKLPIIHSATKLQLDNLLNNNRVHAVCLVGPAGSGKSYLAEYFAKKCLNSDKLYADSHYLKIDGLNKEGIEQVREIKQFISLKVPSNNKFNRCIQINNIEYLSIPAQNALLKIIEEPPEDTIIVCTAARMKKVIPTIVSRLHKVQVRPVSINQLKSERTLELADTDFNKYFMLSEGRVGAFLGFAKKDGDSQSLLDAIEKAKTILKNNRFERLAEVDNLIKSDKFSLEQLTEALCLVLRALILNKLNSSKDLKSLTAKLEFCLVARKNLEYNISKKLVLTQLFYNL